MSILAAVALYGRPVRAEARAESVAQTALTKAANEYAKRRYGAAALRLVAALRGCRGNRCSPASQAELWRDLGAIQFRSGNKKGASKSWTRAFKLQPDLGLSPDYDAPDVRAAWEAARAPGAVTASGSPTGESSRAESKGGPATEDSATEPAPDLPTNRESLGSEKEEETATPAHEESQSVIGAPYARLWIGVSGALDYVLMKGADDACKVTSNLAPANPDHYYCTNPKGSGFPSADENAHLVVPGGAGHVDGALRAGNVRLLLAIDYALSQQVLVGARFGVVLNAYSGDAAVRDGRALGPKVHGEVRATYVLGRNPLSHEGFAPTGFVGGGVSEFDAQTSTVVMLDNVSGPQTKRAWLTDAPFFVVLGAGARYQFSARLQVTLAARVNGAFGGNGVLPTFGPELSIQAGL